MGQFAVTGTLYEVGLRQLGELLITQALRDVAKVFLNTPMNKYERMETQQSVLFIRGSGLEAISEKFGLNLDVETLHHQFQWKLRQFIASSRTTLDGHCSRGA